MKSQYAPFQCFTFTPMRRPPPRLGSSNEVHESHAKGAGDTGQELQGHIRSGLDPSEGHPIDGRTGCDFFLRAMARAAQIGDACPNALRDYGHVCSVYATYTLRVKSYGDHALLNR